MKFLLTYKYIYIYIYIYIHTHWRMVHSVFLIIWSRQTFSLRKFHVWLQNFEYLVWFLFWELILLQGLIYFQTQNFQRGSHIRFHYIYSKYSLVLSRKCEVVQIFYSCVHIIFHTKLCYIGPFKNENCSVGVPTSYITCKITGQSRHKMRDHWGKLWLIELFSITTGDIVGFYLMRL